MICVRVDDFVVWARVSCSTTSVCVCGSIDITFWGLEPGDYCSGLFGDVGVFKSKWTMVSDAFLLSIHFKSKTKWISLKLFFFSFISLKIKSFSLS